MNELISCVLVIALASVIVSVLKSILPEGHIKSSIQFIYGILLTVLICIPIINFKNYDFSMLDVSHDFNAQDTFAKGVEIQIRQITGFKNAQISVSCDNGEVSGLYVVAKKSDSTDLLSFEKNKKVLSQLMNVLYKLDENKIVIEVE